MAPSHGWSTRPIRAGKRRHRTRSARGVTPVLFTMGRFEETLRQWYDLLTSDKTQSYIDEHRDKNKWLAALADAMQENKLPPFDVLLQYAPVTGNNPLRHRRWLPRHNVRAAA